ncbi:MAG TPA: hypothetical protein VMW11_11120 [Candidatus Dormibacteraeota bacterium]|nr:hypothetical protein [Candidatus Dormibacteraeota bacterium]
MRAILLKVGATVLTFTTTAVAAVYVTSHLKNPAAPLRPTVLIAPGSTTFSAPGGTLTVGPSVQPSDVQPVTSTYAS